jgi:hypothetical protein
VLDGVLIGQQKYNSFLQSLYIAGTYRSLLQFTCSATSKHDDHQRAALFVNICTQNEAVDMPHTSPAYQSFGTFSTTVSVVGRDATDKANTDMSGILLPSARPIVDMSKDGEGQVACLEMVQSAATCTAKNDATTVTDGGKRSCAASLFFWHQASV